MKSPPRPPVALPLSGSCLCLAPPASSVWAKNEDRRVLEISKDLLMRVDNLLNSRLDLLRLSGLLKICLMFELSNGSIFDDPRG